MKKTRIITLIAAVALLALSACNPTEDPLLHLTDGVNVITADPTHITGSTASCGAEVTATDNGLLIELGVCWNTAGNPTVDDHVMKSHKCSKPYLCLLTNLEYNTQYHVRGYAQYGTEICYGEEKTFTTLDSLTPAASPVTTLEAYDITPYSFSSGAIIEPFGAPVYYAGVCYSINSDFTFYDCEGYGTGGFDENGVCHAFCYDLMPNTQYYYRAFAAYTEDAGYNYNFFFGDILSFTTPDVPLNIELYTYDINYEYWGGYFYAYGCVRCNKPNVINQVGFCYSTTNEYPQYESDLITSAGTPTGEWYDFGSYIYNLSANTKYYIRPYARYLNDSIRYGDVSEVSTY